MPTVEIAAPQQIAPVSIHRSGIERLRDAAYPYWRRARWAIRARLLGGSVVNRQVYDVSRVHLTGEAAERAREILARRTTP